MRNVRKLVRKSAAKNVSSTHALAETAYREADYDVCRRLLDGAVPTDRAERGAISVLRARSAQAENDAERAYAAATSALAELEDPQLRLLATVLRAGSAKALGKTREARALFEEAARDIFRFPSSEVGAARYLLAVEALEGQDFVRADALARENVAAATYEAQSTALLGTIANKRERYSEAANQFAAALRKFQASGDVDARLEAEIVSSLAVVATETVDLRLTERVRKAYDKLAWTPSLNALRFRTITALRAATLLEGDLPGAFFASREAIGVAAGTAQEALAEVNAAVASRLLGDAAAERLELRRGWDAMRDGRFEPGDDESRLALLTFIIEAADAMPAEARKAMTLYRSSTPKAAAAALSVDRRFVALEAQASGRIADAAGDDDTAIRLYEHAFETWRAIGFDARAVLAALDLRRLTGDESYAGFVRSVLSRAPKAWFAKQLRAAASPADLLSPAERVVLGYLLNGDSAKAIAAKLDRSPFTISNHTRKIFQAFELNSRGKVIARCAELGITAAKLERDSR
jgi:DNA-binding CsgD family transcriptional regulator